MGTQVSMNKQVPDLLFLEREVDSVISSVQTEVSKYELATNFAILDSDSDLDMDDIICNVGNNVKGFCCSSSYFHKSLAVFFYSLCRSIFRLSERQQLL